MKKCGIYKITNPINLKCYIGYSSDITTRWASHRRNLRRNTHVNPYLQSAYNIPNSHEFIYEIIHKCSISDLPMYEKYFIKKYNAFYKNGGYNMTPGGDGQPSGENHPNYGKKRLDLAGKPAWNKGLKGATIAWNKGLKRPNPYGCYNEKKIDQFDLNGNFVKRWNSITETSTQYNMRAIGNCLRGRTGSSCKYIWRYAN